jgi:hypothetical protein
MDTREGIAKTAFSPVIFFAADGCSVKPLTREWVEEAERSGRMRAAKALAKIRNKK